MAQLVVRKIEEEVVARLRQRAARRGVSMEEEHRRILREAVLGKTAGRRRNLKEYLAAMPGVGEDEVFERTGGTPRPVDL